MYDLSYREVAPFHNDMEDGDTGIIISIKPPIDMNPNVLAGYLIYGVINKDMSRDNGSNDMHNIVVLGSTQESTSIYVGSMENVTQETALYAMERTAELITLLGATALVSE